MQYLQQPSSSLSKISSIRDAGPITQLRLQSPAAKLGTHGSLSQQISVVEHPLTQPFYTITFTRPVSKPVRLPTPLLVKAMASLISASRHFCRTHLPQQIHMHYPYATQQTQTHLLKQTTRHVVLTPKCIITPPSPNYLQNLLNPKNAPPL